MIFDKIENLKNYAELAPEVFEKVSAFLGTLDANSPDGRTELMGADLYAMVQRYNTHLHIPEKLENHEKYIDIQLLLDGEEIIYYSPVEGCKVTVPYDETKDCAFFYAEKEGMTALELKPGNFAVFLPIEGHAPGCGDPDKAVVKVVIKINRSLFRI